jgi:hypothetical protein|tara:strand:+ start:78 stop:836 length:759 start_codon:yes stop_codon:yes gene_type:complete
MNRDSLASTIARISLLDDDAREQVEAVPFEALASTIDEALAKREWISRSHWPAHPLRPKVSVEEGPSSHGRRYFIKGECGDTVIEHDIASDPAITSDERLKAHLNSTLEIVLREHAEAQQKKQELVSVVPTVEGPVHRLGTLRADALRDSIRLAKRALESDFTGGWQILAVDADGDRVTSDGDAVAHGLASDQPTLKLLRELAASWGPETDYEARELVIEGMGYAFADWGNAIERREHGEPTGEWWQVSVVI